MKGSLIALAFALLMFSIPVSGKSMFDTTIKPGAANSREWIRLLAGKHIALVINQTSCVGDSSVLDMILARHIAVQKIMVPEHGFRGSADAGAHIDNGKDETTGLPVISLYGNHKKPTTEDLEGIDVVVYDLQDVGVRFYTYISTMEYCMEACAQQGKMFVVLDRPNPNGFYIDGPVLQKENRSFVGMQAVPVVYGMTCGEYAQMLKGENWFDKAANLDLHIIKCANYDHKKKYALPIAPSPNLKNMAAVYAYPSICLFEGTRISVGRGTAFPFQQWGAPELPGKYKYAYTPTAMPGAKNPPYEGKTCYGVLIGETPEAVLKEVNNRLEIKWLKDAYEAYPEKDKFFTDFFTKLAGTTQLQEQVKRGISETAIRKSWRKDIDAFKKIRSKYLLYRDF